MTFPGWNNAVTRRPPTPQSFRGKAFPIQASGNRTNWSMLSMLAVTCGVRCLASNQSRACSHAHRLGPNRFHCNPETEGMQQAISGYRSTWGSAVGTQRSIGMIGYGNADPRNFTVSRPRYRAEWPRRSGPFLTCPQTEAFQAWPARRFME